MNKDILKLSGDCRNSNAKFGRATDSLAKAMSAASIATLAYALALSTDRDKAAETAISLAKEGFGYAKADSAKQGTFRTNAKYVRFTIKNWDSLPKAVQRGVLDGTVPVSRVYLDAKKAEKDAASEPEQAPEQAPDQGSTVSDNITVENDDHIIRLATEVLLNNTDGVTPEAMVALFEAVDLLRATEAERLAA